MAANVRQRLHPASNVLCLPHNWHAHQEQNNYRSHEMPHDSLHCNQVLLTPVVRLAAQQRASARAGLFGDSLHAVVFSVTSTALEIAAFRWPLFRSRAPEIQLPCRTRFSRYYFRIITLRAWPGLFPALSWTVHRIFFHADPLKTVPKWPQASKLSWCDFVK
jgi:hypothetical protein